MARQGRGADWGVQPVRFDVPPNAAAADAAQMFDFLAHVHNCPPSPPATPWLFLLLRPVGLLISTG